MNQPSAKTPTEELSPADKKLAEEGGAIAPGFPSRKTVDFKDGAPKIQEIGPPIPGDGPTGHVISAAAGVLSRGRNAPPGYKEPEKSEEQIAFEILMGDTINYELWIFNSCLASVKNMVRDVMLREPPDSAEFSNFSGGKRTPLEVAEPYIAIDVYRQVRRNLREVEEREKPPSLLRRMWRVLWRALVGRKKDEHPEEVDQDPARPPEEETPEAGAAPVENA